VGVTVLCVGRSGFAVSAGTDAIFAIHEGVNVDPALGLGYVYYDVLYLGGILNVIPKPYIEYDNDNNGDYGSQDVFLAPTLVAGFDFGFFLVGAQVSYMRGVMSGVDGF
jgi:hypothetical protein